MIHQDVIVVIPALNEESAIGHVLDALPPCGEVIVVDNGSTDGTASIAEQHGATVLREPARGYGAACLRGLKYLAGLDHPPQIVVFIDGDFSDDPAQLPQLIEPIRRGQADFVVGSRMRGERERGAMPWHSQWGNRLAGVLMWLRYGFHYTDLGPFRAIDYRALQRLEMSDRNYGWTIEMQIKALARGLRVMEVPVAYRRRIGKSKISGTIRGSIGAATKILWSLFKYGFFSGLPRRGAGQMAQRKG